MKLRTNPALAGYAWMRSGVAQVRAQPMALAGLMGFVTLTLGLLLTLPWVGPVMVAVLAPALSAGWVHAVGSVAPGQRATVSLLLAPLLSTRRTALLTLGLLHAGALALTLLLADTLDPSLSDAWSALRAEDASTPMADEAMLQTVQSLQSGLLLRLVMVLPTMLLFWHAPVLIHREGASVAKALFASALASWRNLGAFVVYGVSWALADLVLSVVVGGVLGLLGLAQIALMLAVPVALLFSAAFYASLHASVSGCLDFDVPAAAPDMPQDSPQDAPNSGPDAT